MTFHYVCAECSFDVLSGGILMVCPHCGGTLNKVNVHHVPLPAPPPPDRRIETQMDDVLRGFEKLLREAADDDR
jgi:hypothetical protein